MDQGIPLHSEHQILKGIFGGKGKIRQPKIIMNFSPEPLLEGWNSLTGNAGIDPGSKLCDLTQRSATVCLNNNGWLSKGSLQARFCKACRYAC